jgi:ligand-binding sensor domain-containing protein/signal transduction histidine kinase
MKAIRYFFLLILHGIYFIAVSQNQHVKFESIGTEKGLSQSNVVCILQDSRGFMWFGTQDGLNRYDGYKFTVFKNDPRDPHSLSNSYVKDLLEDSKGNIWVATLGGGLNKFDREKNRFVHYRQDKKKPGSLSDDFVNCLTEDSGGNLWIGTETGGLNRLDMKTGRFTSYIYDKNHPGSISDNDVTTIFEDSRHRIWVGTFNGGMNLLDKAGGSFTRFQHSDKDGSSLAHNTVLRFFEDHKHRLWIGTRGGGLDMLSLPDNHFLHFKNDPGNSNSLSRNVILSMAGDDNHNLWIGTENGGLSIFNIDTRTFTNYLHDDIDNTSLSNNSIYSIYKDSHNNMWVGTYSGGINLYNKNANQFAHFKHSSSAGSLANNNILEFLEDSRGNIWIGTDGGGVELFDPKTEKFTHFRHQPGNPRSICGDYVISLREDKDNNIWMGTCGDGTTVYNPSKKTFRHIKTDPVNDASISGNNVGAIVSDKDKELWLTSWGNGLNHYQSKTGNFIRYKHDSSTLNSISSDRIIYLFADSKGYIWIGTFDKGLDLFDKKTKTFTHFVHDSSRNSLSDNNIHCIYEDKQGNIWIGTKSGLNRLDRKTRHFTNYFIRDGLPGAHVYGIIEDDKGNLWISTNNGMSRYNPQTGIFKNFSIADGLQSNEFKAHSSLKSSAGELYFGGVNGFNKFHPDSIKDNSPESPLVITNFQIFNKEVQVSEDEEGDSPLQKDISETKEIIISYKQSVISFDFAYLNYVLSEKKQYSYMLEGFDNTWNEVGVQHTATYTNLNPGTYVFRVRAMNSNGSWSVNTANINLTILPPFWQTWWFKTCAVLFVLICLIAFYRIRMGVVTNQKEQLEKQVKDRTAEIVLLEREQQNADLEKAVAQGKFEIASEVMHDIGNAVVGFGAYITRIKRSLEDNHPEKLDSLAGFFRVQQPALCTAIGEAKAGAVVNMLAGISETQKSNEDEIRKSISEQRNIITHIEEILNIQRQYIDGQSRPERKPVSIRNIINDSLSMVLALVEKKGITVTLDVAADLPGIKGDRTRLMQLILNLFKNSIEAFDAGSGNKTILINAFRHKNQLVVQVKDNGTGFDESVAARLFERGFTTKPSGSGLGLYNCITIMESHEGDINLTSDGEGKGAVATIGFNL